MSQPIEELYVELNAVGEDDAARDVKRAVDKMERDVDQASREMERDLSSAFKDAADSIERELERSGSILSKTAVRQRKEILNLGNDIVEVFDDVGDAVTGVAGALRGGGGGGGGGLVGDLAQMGSQLRGISALLPSPLIAGLVAAVPAIIALGGALLDLSGIVAALPAAFAVMQAGLFTLKTAFSGVGDAIKALETGNIEKINEAMKDLAPAAQAFAREIHALQEPLGQLRKTVQQAFFAPFQGEITKLVRAALPTLSRGMADVADAFGNFARELFQLLGSNDILEDIGDVFETTARIIENISPSVIKLLGVMFGVIERGLPFVERAFGALGDGMERFAGFLSGSLQDGSFEDFLEGGINVLKDLGDLAGSVFELMKALFGDAGDEGRTFIQTLTEMVDKLTEFLNSAEGQDALQRLLDTLPLLLTTIEGAVTLFAAIVVITERWYQFLEDLGGAVVTAGEAIGNFFAGVYDWVLRAGEATGDFFGKVGTFFSELPGKVTSALQALPGLAASLLQDLIDGVTYAIGFIVGTITGFFLGLPTQAGEALSALVTTAVNMLSDLRDRAIGIVLTLATRVTDTVKNMVDRVVGFFRDLPGRAGGAVSSLPQRIMDVLGSLARRAYQAGKDMLNGLRNGIADAIGGAIDAARNAASRIVKGFKDALIIGSPSKLMADEVGAPIIQGVAVGMRQEQPAISDTLNSLTNAATSTVPGLAAGSARGGDTGVSTGTTQSIVFDAGAVQVVFEGVVPTEAEATRTGAAVGQGIAQTLSRRDVRTLVRTA